jgi:Luciferase
MLTLTLPPRHGSEPRTGLRPPQLQFSDISPRSVYLELKRWMFSSFPHAREEATRISVPSSRALWLNEDVPATRDAFMPPSGSREFAHVHEDGSLHVVLGVADQAEVIRKKWGIPHPWKNRGVNEILIFAPRNSEEMAIVKPVISASYAHATGQEVAA